MTEANAVAAMRFTEYFREIHGVEPFPWQQRLLTEVLESRWPECISLPTASGKTALIDVMLFALATQADLPASERTVPRRLFYVIDRRIIVDEVGERATRIASALDRPEGDACAWVAERLRAMSGERPLVTTALRGGLYRDDHWVDNPAQVLVCVTTVDQIGSRLLFRGYGLSDFQLPIHAGLAGNDALYLIDEAHLSAPLIETLRCISVFRNRSNRPAQELGGPLRVIEMSATPQSGAPNNAVFKLDAEDRNHPILKRRLQALKPAILDECKESDAVGQDLFSVCLAAHAIKLSGLEDACVIGVITNRVATARTVFDHLKASGIDTVLLTGRIREWDRDQLLVYLLPRMRAGRQRAPTGKLFVVATQTIEVGANIDFDALITEAAPLDALRQRFGRLNRLGERQKVQSVIVFRKRAVRKEDPVYGARLDADWTWLKQHATGKGKNKSIDFGIDALDNLLESNPASTPPKKPAAVLLPAHVRLLTQTSPRPHPDPDVAPFLHGTQRSSTDVALIWRADLEQTLDKQWPDIVAAYPPRSREALNVPVWAAQQWLTGLPATAVSDLETVADHVNDSAEEVKIANRRVLRWRGLDNSKLIEAAEMRPGDTLIVPTNWGGADAFGWNPSSTESVRDIAEWARMQNHDSKTAEHRVRLQAHVLPHLLPTTAQPLLASLVAAVDGYLRRLGDPLESDFTPPGLEGVRTAWRSAVPENAFTALPADFLTLTPYPTDTPIGLLLGSPNGELFTDDDDSSSLTAPVKLRDHLDGVGHCINRFATWSQVPPAIHADLVLAGRLHDLGKAEFRFQVMLHGGDEMAALLAAQPLAKSAMDSTNWPAMRRARALSKLPNHFRHEVFSVALIDSGPVALSVANDPDLVRYLVGTHHGRGRPFFSPISDSAPEMCELTIFGYAFKAQSDTAVWHLDYGWTDLFWRLTERYGIWGLAWLETLVRLGDRRRSIEEQQS